MNENGREQRRTLNINKESDMGIFYPSFARCSRGNVLETITVYRFLPLQVRIKYCIFDISTKIITVIIFTYELLLYFLPYFKL